METTIHNRETEAISLTEAQALVGGYVQVIQLGHDCQMLINEEGKLKGLPINEPATELARPYLFEWDMVVGNVVLLRGKALWE